MPGEGEGVAFELWPSLAAAKHEVRRGCPSRPSRPPCPVRPASLPALSVLGTDSGSGEAQVLDLQLCKVLLFDDTNYPCWLVLVPRRVRGPAVPLALAHPPPFRLRTRPCPPFPAVPC